MSSNSFMDLLNSPTNSTPDSQYLKDFWSQSPMTSPVYSNQRTCPMAEAIMTDQTSTTIVPPSGSKFSSSPKHLVPLLQFKCIFLASTFDPFHQQSLNSEKNFVSSLPDIAQNNLHNQRNSGYIFYDQICWTINFCIQSFIT